METDSYRCCRPGECPSGEKPKRLLRFTSVHAGTPDADERPVNTVGCEFTFLLGH